MSNSVIYLLRFVLYHCMAKRWYVLNLDQSRQSLDATSRLPKAELFPRDARDWSFPRGLARALEGPSLSSVGSFSRAQKKSAAILVNSSENCPSPRENSSHCLRNSPYQKLEPCLIQVISLLSLFVQTRFGYRAWIQTMGWILESVRFSFWLVFKQIVIALAWRPLLNITCMNLPSCVTVLTSQLGV